MSSAHRKTSPIRVLVGALGGEGGGVLTGWIMSAAEACGYPAQTTSIPGVAQRTGSTAYYIEIFPVRRDSLEGKGPVLALSPVPGAVDLVVASELLEAGRMAQAGYVSPDCTALIASSHRSYTVAEKMAMGDGRLDAGALVAALRRVAKRAALFDMEAAARDAGTILSAVMLGAIAGSGLLPMPRSAFEDAIRAAGKGAEASLKGFELGYVAVTEGSACTAPAPRAGLSKRPVPKALLAAVLALGERTPEALRPLVEEGFLRQADFQGMDYANLYLDRVERVLKGERAGRDGARFPVTEAYARFLALWMSYEDIIRVADLKSRASRFERVRTEAGAQPSDIVETIEFLKPGVEEWCSVLPSRLAGRVRRWAARGGDPARFSVPIHVKTTSIHGFLMLRALASFKWWRPRSSRFAEEQALIERWTDSIIGALPRSAALALELAQCGRLIKGYGDTHARGKANFLRILDTVAAGTSIGSDAERAKAVRDARESALADPEGRKLEQSLAAHGIAPLPPKPKPIVWKTPPRPGTGR